MSIRPEPLYIIAGTLAQAKATAVDRGLPASPWTREWTWVREANDLRGRRGITFVLGYGATERRDWDELVEHLAFVGVQAP